MKLYNLPPGMNPRRVRIYLAEKGIEVPMVDVDMMKGENRTAEFLALNPLGTLPVLELDDGTVLSESIAICRYFEMLHPEPHLFGRGPVGCAQVEMWNRRVELELMIPLAQAFRHGHEFWKGRLTQIPAYADVARARAFETLGWLDKELGERQYMGGDEYSVADITAQCAVLLGKNTGAPLPESCTNLGRWWTEVSARPSARA